MTTPCEALISAYRREERAYSRIMELVGEQDRIMSTRADPRALVELCGLVQGLMGEIGGIERTVEPVKRRWEAAGRRDPEGELDAVLSAVQDSIDRIAGVQEHVRQLLVQYVGDEQRRTQAAQAGLTASRARAVYGSA